MPLTGRLEYGFSIKGLSSRPTGGRAFTGLSCFCCLPTSNPLFLLLLPRTPCPKALSFSPSPSLAWWGLFLSSSPLPPGHLQLNIRSCQNSPEMSAQINMVSLCSFPCRHRHWRQYPLMHPQIPSAKLLYFPIGTSTKRQRTLIKT